MSKKIVISCGPIPARLDSVKFITNRFKGGLAFATAKFLVTHCHYDVTIVKWKHTAFPVDIDSAWKDFVSVINVNDVQEYYDYFYNNGQPLGFDAFIMAAAVANLMPSEPYEGKFPSHLYKPGDKFDIKFEIAPRAIDIVKKLNPRACLIGYKLFDAQSDEELIDIARHTLVDSKANIIFANTPRTAKSKKIAVMADNAAIPMTFDDHLNFIIRAIEAQYYRTEIIGMPDQNNPLHTPIRVASDVVRMYENTFNGFGTVAMPVAGGGFVTTSRGHKTGPVYVQKVDHENHVVYATGKATLNAPTLSVVLEANPACVVVHRHADDPRFDQKMLGCNIPYYTFPGTTEEVMTFRHNQVRNAKLPYRMMLPFHGDMKILPIQSIDWNRYYELFPSKYFDTPDILKEIMRVYNKGRTLEVGCNTRCACKYAYDEFVKIPDKSISWSSIKRRAFSFVLARNCAAYLTDEQITTLLKRSETFAANVFLKPPVSKVTNIECATKFDNQIQHTLLLDDDSVMTHWFFAREKEDWERLGLTVTPYGGNSALLTKGIPMEALMSSEAIVDESGKMDYSGIKAAADLGRQLSNGSNINAPEA